MNLSYMSTIANKNQKMKILVETKIFETEIFETKIFETDVSATKIFET